ncbi:YdeI/OmpD-associated family protein [Aridibaculum aurantiacum]|uniref:YdeI/OmpD-associated family protein n=1 Tax=Aridibaculum aurantiacum TaxID=2810307 RepID=UPI001A968B15|nr:YdeI/OmpD-associated family protein [Aridibaculum aurantiacum]
MPQSLVQKLKIQPASVIRVLHAPEDFAELLAPLPAEVVVTEDAAHFDQLHWFVKDKAALHEDLPKVLELVVGNIVCWIYFPKGSSKIQTDLNRDSCWQIFQQYSQFQFLTLISFNETWSAFGMRLKSSTGSKSAKPKEREITKFIDATTKQVTLPPDLDEAIAANTEATNFFASLSFSNKKEYVEWVVSAKREETRKQRIEGTVERLLKRWKNPRNI